jgi:hypothetical protein
MVANGRLIKSGLFLPLAKLDIAVKGAASGNDDQVSVCI